MDEKFASVVPIRKHSARIGELDTIASACKAVEIAKPKQ
jgi:hypothetical protein